MCAAWPTALVGIALAAAARADAPARNGFVLEPATIPVEEIVGGGPLRDGIPALDHPETVGADRAPWPDDELVLGVALGGEARAYPVSILGWHELVNDALGGRPILVSYCPLCGTGIAFDRRVAGSDRNFGVSGLLYRSDLLMYDRESESLWSQISAEAVTGPLAGTRLRLVRSAMTRWDAWRRAHPHTTVLARDTGHRRDYDHSPYPGYATSEQLAFPVRFDRRYHPKMPTLGLRTASREARAYPAVELVRAGGAIDEVFHGERVRVAYDPKRQLFDVEAPESIEVVEGYWFAWAAFHPETTVFATPRAGESDAAGGSSRPDHQEESTP